MTVSEPPSNDAPAGPAPDQASPQPDGGPLEALPEGVPFGPTPLPGVLVIRPPRHRDSRGFFSESWTKQRAAEAGITCDFLQDNHAVSDHAGTLRGLHYQAPPHAQDKLVRCGRGRLWDVAVDIRQGSPSYGAWFGLEISAKNGLQLFIPKGFLHGYITLEPDSEILYKCSEYYAPQSDRVIRFDDPQIDIRWPIPPRMDLLSDKDRAAPTLAEAGTPFGPKAPA